MDFRMALWCNNKFNYNINVFYKYPPTYSIYIQDVSRKNGNLIYNLVSNSSVFSIIIPSCLDPLILRRGVPQGSMSGLLLFIIHR